MKNLEYKHEAVQYESINELSAQDRDLIEKANETKSKAYAPYSKFNVGAAILLANNKIILGKYKSDLVKAY